MKSDERAIYKQVNRVVDIVHGYLVHGQEQIYLMESIGVYNFNSSQSRFRKIFQPINKV